MSPVRSTSLVALRAEVAVIVAEAVEAAEAEVEKRPVQGPLTAPELVEEGFQVVGQLLDLVEAHHGRRPLDGVDQPERLAQRLVVVGRLLEAEQRLVQRGDLLVGLVEVVGQHARQVESGHRRDPPRLTSGRFLVEPRLALVQRSEQVIHPLRGADHQVTPRREGVQEVPDNASASIQRRSRSAHS